MNKILNSILSGKSVRSALMEGAGSIEILPYKINKIKRLAKANFEKYGETGEEPELGVYSAKTDQFIINPWMDSSARFELTDDEAVKEWGLDLILTYCMKALTFI